MWSSDIDKLITKYGFNVIDIIESLPDNHKSKHGNNVQDVDNFGVQSR